ncbi:MAG TPA: phosphate-starvation-inducible PsiE family protein [Phenylobacterium sp.]|jgi:uncharacterized membrane protein (DUF373 family)|uniref:phosphate-starvation-inducible PsiE family protein n=1 Tax=Phenylobacterium sp. TaxID=1871053 RepID=UPI002C836474|nr:phosphate-starvation-inducible PsiE family protein [Phenylobacterium sp.]HXA37374.1 phosphate-starvation-inducible PsiE family protein [Phenylobacterium sp.]
MAAPWSTVRRLADPELWADNAGAGVFARGDDEAGFAKANRLRLSCLIDRAQGKPMDTAKTRQREVNRLGAAASDVFLTVEVLAYVVLGVMLAIAVLVGVRGAAVSLWDAIQARGETEALVLAVDRLLFVLMVVEIMHTVRVSFRSGRLVCEPFLIVGLIASIRRVLVITLETSQAHQPGKWNPDAQSLLNSTMLELAVLGALILVMVISIYMLRRSDLEHGDPVSAPGSV